MILIIGVIGKYPDSGYISLMQKKPELDLVKRFNLCSTRSVNTNTTKKRTKTSSTKRG
jgi:hypothetical protein